MKAREKIVRCTAAINNCYLFDTGVLCHHINFFIDTFLGGKYKLEIKIPDTYPFNPPKVNICLGDKIKII